MPATPEVPPTGPDRSPRRARKGSAGVGAVLVAAGFLFTTSAQTARGTQLRSERADLAGLIQAEQARLETRRERRAALAEEVERDTDAKAAVSAAIRDLKSRSAPLLNTAGVRPVHGPALEVTLNDAPRDKPVPAQARPDDLVVHQQDVQGVVNAMWAGGAEAMMLQDQRVISTSAVRCVGNTLILQGRVYSPPYKITAIGDVAGMRRALDESPDVAYYLQYVESMHLGWRVRSLRDTTLPGFEGSLRLAHARVPRAASVGGPAGGGTAGPSTGPSTGTATGGNRKTTDKTVTGSTTPGTDGP